MSKAHVNTLLRTEDTWFKYQNNPKKDDCFLCNMETVQCFNFWYICENEFPYDAVAETHHMLVSIEHISHEKDLSPSAKRELDFILDHIDNASQYDCVLRNFKVGQSQPQHLHYHLVTWKRQ